LARFYPLSHPSSPTIPVFAHRFTLRHRQRDCLDGVFDRDREEKKTVEEGKSPSSTAAVGDRSPDRLNRSQPEGISITKVSRGDRRWTFPNELAGAQLFSLAISQVEEFTAETFFTLAEQTAL
jgi:hypothetical protein